MSDAEISNCDACGVPAPHHEHDCTKWGLPDGIFDGIFCGKCSETFQLEIDFIGHLPCVGDIPTLEEVTAEITAKLPPLPPPTLANLIRSLGNWLEPRGNYPLLDNFVSSITNDDYNDLARVLSLALIQAGAGKGKERHNKSNAPFDEQQIVHFGRRMGTTAYNIGQACKKAEESMGLGAKAAVKELLGAINYLAGAIIILEMLDADKDTSELENDAFYEKGDF